MLPRLLGFLVLLASFARAEVQVAFLEIRAPDGHLVQLEPGGRFAHSAVFYNGQWLQAYPGRGVELVKDLSPYGDTIVVLINENWPTVESLFVSRVLGSPFDHAYEWGDDSFYCAELVAKALGIPPRPMHFDSAIWPRRMQSKEGMPGMSPDELYRELKARGFHP